MSGPKCPGLRASGVWVPDRAPGSPPSCSPLPFLCGSPPPSLQSVTPSLCCLCTHLICPPALAPTLFSSLSISVPLCGGVGALREDRWGGPGMCWPFWEAQDTGTAPAGLLVLDGPERTGQWQWLAACHLEAPFPIDLLLPTWPTPCFLRPWPQAELRWPVVLLGPLPWDPRQHAGAWHRPQEALREPARVCVLPLHVWLLSFQRLQRERHQHHQVLEGPACPAAAQDHQAAAQAQGGSWGTRAGCKAVRVCGPCTWGAHA